MPGRGYLTITDPDHPRREFDTVSCCHCSAIIRVKPRTLSTVYLVFDPAARGWQEVPGAGCWHCHRPICPACYAQGTCVPLERMLERMEAR